MQKYGRFGETPLYELDRESKMRLLKTHSHTSNGLAMEPKTREENKLKETQTLQQGKSHPSKTCRVPPVWRGGGAENALEPAACRRCGGGGQERLYGKPTTAKVLWRGKPSSIWRGTQALTQGRSHAKKPPAGYRHGGGLDEETTNTGDGRWPHLQPREGGECLAEKIKVKQI